MDFFLEIEYPIKTPEEFKITSDFKKEYWDDILCTYLQSIVGGSKDESEMEDRDVYHIHIDFSLTNDEFKVRSDTGNQGLTVGIILDVISRLDSDT